MAIEVNNESGLDFDERAVLDIARYALGRMRIHPLSELSVIAGAGHMPMWERPDAFSTLVARFLDGG
jgi:pimeloyl-ACP methyl ester carboxylesterase